MRIVISKEDYGLLEYTQVKTVQEVLDMVELDAGEVEGVVYHTTDESLGEVAVGLTQIKTKVAKLIYIRQEPVAILVNLIHGLEGSIYDNEEMLRDEGVLDYLYEAYGETGMELKKVSKSIEQVDTFISTIISQETTEIEKLKANTLWMQTVEKTIGDMKYSIERSEVADVELVTMLADTIKYVTKIEKEQKTVNKELKETKRVVDEMERRYSEMGQNTAFYFTTYTVPNTVTRVLNVKVYSPCPYLKSFLESYQHYLKMEKQMSSKMLIAIPKLKQVMRKYEGYARLDAETIGYMKVGAVDDVMVTHEPKPCVLDAFFNMRVDVHIVIDLMYGESLIKGPKVNTLNAISGLKDAQLYGVKAKDCILPLIGTQSSIRIPYIKGFSTESETGQKTAYFQECKGEDGCYARMNDRIGIEN